MLRLALFFLLFAILLGVFGLTGMAGAFTEIATIFLVVFLVLFLVAAVMGALSSRPVT